MLFRHFKVPFSYSFIGSSYGKSATYLFSMKDYESVGAEFCDLLGVFLTKKYPVRYSK